ncbi:MAG: sigma 54-interacting transcriptional regulator [Deltaproteobacteria bacterium]
MAKTSVNTPKESNSFQYPVALEYFEKKHLSTLKEWQKFVNGDKNIDTTIVPPAILESWKRCQAMGIDPMAKPQNTILSGKELQSLLKENEDFIKDSRIFMSHLYGFMSGSRFTITLFDHRGYLLEIMIRDEFREQAERVNWVVGALWDEAQAGNNGVGTLLVIRQPIRVFTAQHYKMVYHKDTVSSAPIYDPTGKFIGGISVLSYYYGTLAMAVAAAKAIENQLQIQKALAAANIAASYQKTVIASIPEAIMTIDNADRMSLINENARRLLRLDARNVEGEHIRDVLGRGNNRFLNIISGDKTITDMEVRIFSENKGNDYTMTCNPIYSSQGDMLGKIIILNEIKRVKTLVAKMIGAKANFQFKDIYGQNIRFLKTIEQAKLASHSTSNVLLLGKSGTGKDIYAQAIHNASERRNGPYVAINCAAIPRDLIASELFGYSDGAFTGSRRGGNQGKFELADEGTIFLDEIAEIPLELQAVLLRVIEDKSIIRLGGKMNRPVNVRIIAATNKNLPEEVRRGNFREDLYYRLNVLMIQMISLQERPDDIKILVDYFVGKYAKIMGKTIERIDPRLIDAFLHYPWPGNVRELQNIIERMMNVTHANELTVDVIPAEILDFRNVHTRSAKHAARDRQPGLEDPDSMISEMKDYGTLQKQTEKKMISEMIAMGIPKNKIAKKMNLSRMTIYRKIKEYGLS